jgi:HEAT repeat protein
VALGNSADASKRPILERLAADADPLIREHAAWALQRLKPNGSNAENAEIRRERRET